MSQRRTILVLCTGNSARSLMAEAILRRDGGDRFTVFSAGSNPTGTPHPAALRILSRKGIDISTLRSKSWMEFATPDAPPLDFVITVCDRAAGEPCPVWPGQPICAHWGLPDPAAPIGNRAERHLAFWTAYKTLELRAAAFLNLPMNRLDRYRLQTEVDKIGTIEMSLPHRTLAFKKPLQTVAEQRREAAE